MAGTLACDPGPMPMDAGPGVDARWPDGASAIDAAPPPGECRLGEWHYTPGGACLPTDPCFPTDPCRAAHRTCDNDAGVAQCGRCLDGYADDAGTCTPETLDTYVGPFAVGRDLFRVWDGAAYRQIFLHGMNLGATPPGSSPREFTVTAETYARWLDQMREAGVNVIRLYTLHPPYFYAALDAHNQAHPEAPIYILQGVWLDDPTDDFDLAPRTDGFEAEAYETIDCLHGAHVIAERPGHAWGDYTVDVSRWTLGFIVGHELSFEEVLTTDATHTDWTSYEGTTMRLASGSPTAVWVTARLDHMVDYEQRTWGVGRPIAFSCWMEVDPLHHPTEGHGSGEDVANLDLGDIEPFGAPAGVFLSYHAYPYYPNFVSEDPRYLAYSDELGVDAYRGLLRDLRAHDPDRAILIAEFGVPTSWGRAHTSASGMHQGGISEADAGTFGARMLRDIDAVGMAGGAYFQWEDGWWKRIWVTNARTFPPERQRIWHDVMNAAASYGVMAFQVVTPSLDAAPSLAGSSTGHVLDVRAVADPEWFHVRLTLDAPLADGESLTIGLDTYADDRGETVLPDGARSDVRCELALEIVAPDQAQLRVTQAYDLLGLQQAVPGSVLHSTATDGAPWNAMQWINSGAHHSDDGVYRFPDELFPIGALRARRAEGTPSSLDAVVLDGTRVDVRLPWTLLQFTDPTSRLVMDDDPSTPEHETAPTDGIALVVSRGGEVVTTARVTWPTWNSAPTTSERFKDGAETLFGAMRAYPRWRE